MYSRTFYPLLLALLAGLFFTACSDTSGNPAGGKTLSGIAVTTQPTKTAYALNEDLDLTGLVVTATYSDGSTAPVTITAANTNWDTVKTTAGNDKPVTITYSGKTATFTVTITKAVQSIAVTTQPTKTTYEINEALDLTGLEVTATFTDSTTGTVTISIVDTDWDTVKTTTGVNKTVTITYGGKTATFTVTIKEVQSIAVTTQPTKTTYEINEALDLTGLVVTATYSDGSTAPVTITAANTDWDTVKTSVGANKTVTISYGGKTTTFTVNIADPHGIEMILIPADTFTMGSSSDLAFEFPQHSVTLSAFKMGKTEITQAQWQAVMGNNPSNFTGDAQLPVEKVSWYDAIEFCNELSVQAGLSSAYTIDKTTQDPNNSSTYDTLKWTVTRNTGASGYRLPTEAEWEYACRARTTTAYYTGDTEDAALQGAAWYSANASSTTHPVGEKTANAWGLHDMHGNVLEWCWDWFSSYSSGSQTDPMGAASGSDRMIRGGDWGSDASYARSARRLNSTPTYRDSGLGFRVVRP